MVTGTWMYISIDVSGSLAAPGRDWFRSIMWYMPVALQMWWDECYVSLTTFQKWAWNDMVEDDRHSPTGGEGVSRSGSGLEEIRGPIYTN